MSGPQAAFFVVSTIIAKQRADAAQEDRRQAAQERQEVQKQRNFRRKQQELRRARAARAQAVAQGQASGAEVGGSSAVQGTTASIQSQAASNISFLDNMNRAGESITSSQISAQENQRTANLFGDLAGRSGQVGTIFEEVSTDDNANQ